MSDSKSQFSLVTVILHWVIGLTMIGLVAVGFYMDITHAYELYPIHKSMGVLIFLFVIVRVIWRFKNGWPTPLDNYTKFEIVLSKIIHHILLIATILMPISGVVMSAMGGYGVPLFGLELIPANYDPETQKVVPYNAILSEAAGGVHWFIGYLLAISIVLHVAGALKHHFISKDGTLMRMLGKKI